MLFSRIVPVLFAIFAFGLFASGKTVLKRAATCEDGINTLNATVAGVVARFKPVVFDGSTSPAFFAELVEDMTQATEVAALVARVVPPVNGTDPILSALGEVISGMVTVVQSMVELVPDLKSNVADVDTQMTELVTIFNLLDENFLSNLAVLVAGIANIFQVAGMTQLAGVLGF